MRPKLWRTKKAKITLDRLSELTGFPKGYLSEVENGIKPGSAKLIRAYKSASKGLVDFDDFPVAPKKIRAEAAAYQ